MAKTKLDPEEQKLLESYESGEFESDLDVSRRGFLTKAAEEELWSDKLHEAHRRAEELDDGTVQAVPSDEVMSKARALIK